MERLTFTSANRVHDPTLTKWCPTTEPTPPEVCEDAILVDIGSEEHVVLGFKPKTYFCPLSYSQSSITIEVRGKHHMVKTLYWGEDTSVVERRLERLKLLASQLQNSLGSRPAIVVPSQMSYSSVNGKRVLCTKRPFIRGCTLEESWNNLNKRERRNVYKDIERFLCSLSSVELKRYGEIGCQEFSSSSARKYVMGIMRRNRSLRLSPPGSDPPVIGKDESRRILHHMMLTPDNIIVDQGRVVAILGACHIEVVPTSLARAWYKCLQPLGYAEFFNAIHKMLPPASGLELKFTASCYEFVFRMMWDSSTPEVRRELEVQRENELRYNDKRTNETTTQGRANHRSTSSLTSLLSRVSDPFVERGHRSSHSNVANSSSSSSSTFSGGGR